MKKLLNSALALSAILTASAAFAVDGPHLFVQDQPLQPIPEAQSSAPMPTAVGAQPSPAQGEAIPQIVMVKDPCKVPCDPCNPCATPAPRCVAVQICVPPCSPCPPKVTCRRGGEYVKYDFGKYRVEIRSRRGCVTVDYDA
jgi:hypothetical protein